MSIICEQLNNMDLKVVALSSHFLFIFRIDPSFFLLILFFSDMSCATICLGPYVLWLVENLQPPHVLLSWFAMGPYVLWLVENL